MTGKAVSQCGLDQAGAVCAFRDSDPISFLQIQQFAGVTMFMEAQASLVGNNQLIAGYFW